MNLYPIGTISAASDDGTIDSVSYSFFEPNKNCSSQRISNILTTPFGDQTILARKKGLPYITINYEYENIFNREYSTIDHFVEKMDDALTSFYTVDFSKGIIPSSITNNSGDWDIAISNTRLFSIVANQKANKGFITDGYSWKEGDISALTTNTSITVDVDTNNYGNLTLANANSRGVLYPIYQVYFIPNPLQNFKSDVFIDDNASPASNSGFTWNGAVSFLSKYKV